MLGHSTVNIGYKYQGATQNMRAMEALSILSLVIVCIPTYKEISIVICIGSHMCMV